MELDRILNQTELEKLKSTKGIIELLCNIDNVDLDNLEELDYQTRDLIEDTLKINLLSYSQFEGNLRRSMASGNLAIINKRQLTALSLLYFGEKDKTTGQYTHYICPYTGTRYELKNLQSELRKKYNDRDKTKILELEHIMPHSSNGGTILPNIIPISKIANNQKSDMHILDYFKSTGQKDYQNNGPKRLYNLVNYILSAYEIAFSQYNESEIDYLYDYDTKDEDGIDEEDLENERKKLNQQQKQKKLNETPIEGYIPYIKQLTQELQRTGYNIEPINNKIKELEEKGIFKDLDKYDLVQETIENLFKENLSSDNKKTYLSYTTKIDYVKLVNSINTNDLEQIKQIIINRFNNIKYLVNYSQKTMKDYFISMKDMNEEDILYKDVDISNLEDPNIIAFITSLKLGLETKINIFIDMLSDENRIYTSYENGFPDKNNIFNRRNKIPFKGYEKIKGFNTNQFWNNNSFKIEEMLLMLENNPNNTEQDKEKYQRARRAIDEYKFQCQDVGLNLRIECFIEMISEENRFYTSYENGFPNKNNVFKSIQEEPIPFKGYESINGLSINNFWSNNSDKIEEILEMLENNPDNTEKDKAKYQRARRTIEEYIFKNNLEKRIKCFIEMISQENRFYTSYENGVPNKNNIFKEIQEKPISFKGYESIEGLNTNHFWSVNSDKIEKMLEKLESNPENTEKDKEKYQRAKKAIKEYKFQCKDKGLKLRIEVFIDMLTDKQYTTYYKNGRGNEKNIFKAIQKEPIPFKGYENIEGLNTNSFWNSHSTKIISLLFYNKQYDADKKCYIDSEKDYSIKQYDAARNAVLEYLSITDKTTYTNIEQYIDKLEQKEKKTKKVLELIDLRNNLKKISDNLALEESLLIEENKQLINEYIEKQQDTETRRVI